MIVSSSAEYTCGNGNSMLAYDQMTTIDVYTSPISVKTRNKTAAVTESMKLRQTAQPGLQEHGETNCH